MSKLWLLAPVLALVLMLAAQAPALAHAELVQSDPSEGAVLDQAPDRVRLEFDEPVEAEFNPLEVYDTGDNRVDLDDARVESDDPNTLTGSLGELAPGAAYRVEYRVTSPDGDPVGGSYAFVLSDRAEIPARSPEEPGADSPVEEPGDEGGGFGRTMLYGGLLLAGILALTLRLRR